jgi:hypothetical protein
LTQLTNPAGISVENPCFSHRAQFAGSSMMTGVAGVGQGSLDIRVCCGLDDFARPLGVGVQTLPPHVVAPCLARGLAFLSNRPQQYSSDGKRQLVYAERHDEIERAIVREKPVKKWRREWKFALIEADNPGWDVLWDKWFAPSAQEG